MVLQLPYLGGWVVNPHPNFFEMFSILPESAERNIRKNMNIFSQKGHRPRQFIFRAPLTGEAQNQLGGRRKTCLGRVLAFTSRGGCTGVLSLAGRCAGCSHREGAFSSAGGGHENSGGICIGRRGVRVVWGPARL
jgi:hypothetical protein